LIHDVLDLFHFLRHRVELRHRLRALGHKAGTLKFLGTDKGLISLGWVFTCLFVWSVTRHVSVLMTRSIQLSNSLKGFPEKTSHFLISRLRRFEGMRRVHANIIILGRFGVQILVVEGGTQIRGRRGSTSVGHVSRNWIGDRGAEVWATTLSLVINICARTEIKVVLLANLSS